PSMLYKGVRLANARDWAEGAHARLNDLERAFLAASGRRERDELATARRRTRWLAALSAVLIAASAVAVGQTRAARHQRDLATARQLATQAEANSDQQPLSSLLSLESLHLAPTAEERDEAQTALLQGLLNPHHNVIVLKGHAGLVYAVAFS